MVLGRWGQPAELAPAFLFLASAEASFVIGKTLHVSGGKRLGRSPSEYRLGCER
jgi:NAD(P)-dependent dehydrogenase (short-subunit alcohol dehydrogenase family)